MVRKELNVKSALELSGAAVCVQSGTTTELNLADYFKGNKLDYKPVVFEKQEEVDAAYQAGRCDVYTTDQSGLYSIRLGLSNPYDHIILPEIISKEPLGPAVRQNAKHSHPRPQEGAAAGLTVPRRRWKNECKPRGWQQ